MEFTKWGERLPTPYFSISIKEEQPFPPVSKLYDLRIATQHIPRNSRDLRIKLDWRCDKNSLSGDVNGVFLNVSCKVDDSRLITQLRQDNRTARRLAESISQDSFSEWGKRLLPLSQIPREMKSEVAQAITWFQVYIASEERFSYYYCPIYIYTSDGEQWLALPFDHYQLETPEHLRKWENCPKMKPRQTTSICPSQFVKSKRLRCVYSPAPVKRTVFFIPYFAQPTLPFLDLEDVYLPDRSVAKYLGFLDEWQEEKERYRLRKREAKKKRVQGEKQRQQAIIDNLLQIFTGG